jgi:hypothetical protein
MEHTASIRELFEGSVPETPIPFESSLQHYRYLVRSLYALGFDCITDEPTNTAITELCRYLVNIGPATWERLIKIKVEVGGQTAADEVCRMIKRFIQGFKPGVPIKLPEIVSSMSARLFGSLIRAKVWPNAGTDSIQNRDIAEGGTLPDRFWHRYARRD